MNANLAKFINCCRSSKPRHEYLGRFCHWLRAVRMYVPSLHKALRFAAMSLQNLLVLASLAFVLPAELKKGFVGWASSSARTSLPRTGR